MSIEEEGREIAQRLGNAVYYNGPQMYEGEFFCHLFTDTAVTGTTFAAMNLDKAKAALIRKRKEFGAEPPVFSNKEGGAMSQPRTEEERKSFHEKIFGKGSTPPLERLKRGQTVNDMLPMPPDQGPPLPRGLLLKWPWKK